MSKRSSEESATVDTSIGPLRITPLTVADLVKARSLYAKLRGGTAPEVGAAVDVILEFVSLLGDSIRRAPGQAEIRDEQLMGLDLADLHRLHSEITRLSGLQSEAANTGETATPGNYTVH